MMQAPITLQDVAIHYGSTPIIHGLSGCFEPGSLTAIAGENGRGKSTLIKGIVGELPLAHGQIDTGGATGADIAYLAQISTLERSFPFTVADTVILGAWAQMGAFRAVNRTLARKAHDALQQVGLETLQNRPISTLSAGQLQRVLFARLILQNAPVIILDEPFTAIDAGTTRDLITIIKGWHADGRTVIAVLHDMDQIRSHFPQTLLLHAYGYDWGQTETILPHPAHRPPPHGLFPYGITGAEGSENSPQSPPATSPASSPSTASPTTTAPAKPSKIRHLS